MRAIRIGLWIGLLASGLWAQSSASPPQIVPTTTLKSGTGAGNYTTASTTLTPVDSTNQCLTVTIPVGSKLVIMATGSATSATAAVTVTLALTDNASCATANAGVLQTIQLLPGAAASPIPFSLYWVINGDGNAHNVALQYDTAAAADVATILNSSATLSPTMVFQLIKSN